MSHESELARCQRNDVTHHTGCACHEQGWQNKWKAAVEMAAQAENRLQAVESDLDAITLRLGQTQERLIDAHEVIRAATVLIAAKGRHNTFLAYQALKKLIDP